MLKKIIRKWRSFLEGVRNIFYWIPVIYKDRSYDEYYLYKILHHKLSDMERFFRSEYSFTAEANDTANQIAETKDIVRRLIDDNYFIKRVENIDTSEFMNFDNARFNVNRDHPNYVVWSKASDDAYREREEDKKKLFTLMSNNINGWWD